jgi:hypothetical protein
LLGEFWNPWWDAKVRKKGAGAKKTLHGHERLKSKIENSRRKLGITRQNRKPCAIHGNERPTFKTSWRKDLQVTNIVQCKRKSNRLRIILDLNCIILLVRIAGIMIRFAGPDPRIPSTFAKNLQLLKSTRFQWKTDYFWLDSSKLA